MELFVVCVKKHEKRGEGDRKLWQTMSGYAIEIDIPREMMQQTMANPCHATVYHRDRYT
jgi:hypothetical protein